MDVELTDRVYRLVGRRRPGDCRGDECGPTTCDALRARGGPACDVAVLKERLCAVARARFDDEEVVASLGCVVGGRRELDFLAVG